jgi:hypothetical protein
MKPPRPQTKIAMLAALACAVLALALLPGCKKAPKPAAPPLPKPAANKTNAVAAASLPLEFVSVFDDSPPPGNKGRDPFNPDSTSRYPAAEAPKSTAPSSSEPPLLKLYSVAGSPGRWLAVINNQILATNDDPTAVRIQGGRTVMVKVVEIGEDYADVTIDGGAVRQHLTMGQKK